ncbi:MAG: TolC family protein [Acidobacteria bacterium]|nr:TolC family protein [Acidobacteriota bacterium]
MRSVLGFLTALLLAASLFAEPLPRVRIGVVLDGPWAGNEDVLELTRKEILTLTAGEFDVEFPGTSQRVADWTLEGVRREVQALLDDPEVDLVLAWGAIASHTFCCFARLPKPVVAPVVLDAALQGLPRQDGASGVLNLSYVALPDNTRKDLENFLEIVPFRKLAFLASRPLVEAIPELQLRTRSLVDELGLDFEYIPVADSADEVLSALAPDVEAVYLWPLLELRPEELQRLVDGLNGRRLPTFSALSGEAIQAGVLASAGIDEFFPRLARRVALNVQRILLGEDAGTLPVAFSARERLSLNLGTARAIGLSPRWEVLLEARLLDEEGVRDRPRLTLASAVTAAIEGNLDLAADRRRLSVRALDVDLARSRLLPRLGIEASWFQIDDDRTSPGVQAERTASGRLVAEQLIYSEDARAGLAAQGHLLRSDEASYDQLRLDVALATAVAYLDALRAGTLVEVRRNNLELTRSNLELARVRRSVGAAGAAEVYRWESQIAIDRRSLVEASAAHEAARISLARLMHREQEEDFLATEVSLEDRQLLSGEERFRGYIETPRHFRIFRDFTVQEALARAPELAELRAAIAAQERLVRAARRAWWAPTVSGQISVEEILERGGDGSQAPAGLGLPDDTNWSVALLGTLPLFSGGQRRATRLQAELELQRLALVRASAAEKLEEGIRASMIAARASYAAIGLTRQAAEAARKNLDLTADAYGSGAVSILGLLDAQNAYLNADLDATNAVYDFFIDLMQVQRRASHFDFFISAEARDSWFDRLERFYSEAGVRPWSSEPPGAPDPEPQDR